MMCFGCWRRSFRVTTLGWASTEWPSPTGNSFDNYVYYFFMNFNRGLQSLPFSLLVTLVLAPFAVLINYIYSVPVIGMLFYGLTVVVVWMLWGIGLSVLRAIICCPLGGSRLLSVFGLAVLATYVSVVVYLVAYVPVNGWDALDFWVDRAYRLIYIDSKLLGASSWAGIEKWWDLWVYTEPVQGELISRFPGPFPNNHHHPLSLSLIFSAIGSGSSLVGGNLPALYVVMWVIPTLQIILVTLHVEKSLDVNFFFGAFSLILILSTPLVENHNSLVGYSEAWMAVVLASASGNLYLYLKRGELGYLLLSLFSAALMCLLKSSGIFYVFCFAAAFLFERLGFINLIRGGRWHYYFYALVIIFTLGFAYLNLFHGLCSLGVDMRIFGKTFYLKKCEPLFGGASVFYAVFVNQSFSTLFLALILSTSALFQVRTPQRASIFLVWFVAIFIASVFLGAAFLSYFQEHGGPTNDTSLSRLFIPILPTAFLLVLTCASEMGLKARKISCP